MHIHICSLTPSSWQVPFTHEGLSLDRARPPLAHGTLASSHCLWGLGVRKHYLRLSPASVSSWDKPSCRLSTKDLR